MKKFLLFLGLLGAAGTTYAQTTVNLGPWVQVNTTNTSSFSPGYRAVHLSTVAPNVAWEVAEDLTNGVANYFFVTNNAAGTEFYFDAISATGANSAYETANVSGVSATTAVVAKYGATGGGDILRTTNGGLSWTKTTNTATQFVAANGGFLDFVHMFDANEGVAVGDPTNGYFEILRTTNGGVTWTRIPQTSSITPFAGEAALVRSYFALGNTIWFGGASGAATDQERVYKSTDRGVTWTVSAPTPLTETISKLAFKDALNGIAYNTKAAGGALTAVNVIRTSDGGATWQPITPNNTANGSFFWYDIDAANGRYYSVGQRFPSTQTSADFGSSYSTDGVNWTNLNSSQGFFAIDVIPSGTSNATGYAGASTDANGVGGIYKAATLLAQRDAVLQGSLSVFPNPGAAGIFNVNLGSTLKAGAQLTVVDAMGRVVKSQTLNATTVGSKNFTIDLSGEKTGVYTLQLRGEGGIATQKLVIN
ncbi:T9SS type A sorting domain-containing protein [Hymenobacter properus]|uniref:T9SS type A sorting domain-containing protein n=1 Tax=Hymenobacter properus TaxID=2791026 RepID=A0A931FLA9_9BACT|nr:T9SS type A sorting domain-containing protein [Hymenobacter properus]MBF9143983.1 T9SS type A sorting domain-containing protein [Hymenobacter properus]MBR7722798.1 T9SS type A sorting domain-containing protein [Microvirga sp. SRT04]